MRQFAVCSASFAATLPRTQGAASFAQYDRRGKTAESQHPRDLGQRSKMPLRANGGIAGSNGLGSSRPCALFNVVCRIDDEGRLGMCRTEAVGRGNQLVHIEVLKAQRSVCWLGQHEAQHFRRG
jgi:hypothetical protein